jgi:hypothetical protein
MPRDPHVERLAAELADVRRIATDAANQPSAQYGSVEVDGVTVPIGDAVGMSKSAEQIAAKVQGDLEAAREQIAEDLGELDRRVGEAMQVGTDAAATAGTAASTAATAQEKADDAGAKAVEASTKALEAAGLAAGKGKVLYSATEPTGDDRNPANLWIRTSDNKPHTFNATTSAWVPVTDKAATDAATAAAAAATAAGKAQQRADEAHALAGEAAANAQTALASANGKNKVMRSTASPSGTGATIGDLWWRFADDTYRTVIGQWLWSGTSWVQSQVGYQVIASVDVGSLTVAGQATIAQAVIDVLWAQVITARKITTNMLLVGGPQNLIPNGAGELGDATGWSSRLTWHSGTDKPAGYSGALRTPAQQVTFNPRDDNAEFDIIPGTEYLFEIWLRASKPNSRMFLEIRDQDGNHAATWQELGDGTPSPASGGYPVGNLVVPTTWTRYAAKGTFNASVVRARFGSLYVNHPNGTEQTAVQAIAGVRLVPRVGGALLVDGAVTARSFRGDAFDGVVMTGATLQTGSSGQRIVIASNVRNGAGFAGGNIFFYSGLSGESRPGAISAYSDNADPLYPERGIAMSSGSFSIASTREAVLGLFTRDNDGSVQRFINMLADRLQITATETAISGNLKFGPREARFARYRATGSLPKGALTTTGTWALQTSRGASPATVAGSVLRIVEAGLVSVQASVTWSQRQVGVRSFIETQINGVPTVRTVMGEEEIGGVNWTGYVTAGTTFEFFSFQNGAAITHTWLVDIIKHE